MIRLYSAGRAEKIIEEYTPWIDTVAERYSIPAACMKAILRKEIADIDLFDPLADTLVALNWLRYDLRRALRLGETEMPVSRKGILGKLDSSTGYAQIFASTAIGAINYALDRGLEREEELGLSPGERPDGNSARDREKMWRRLQRDRRLNIRTATLNLISAAEEVNGHTDFSRYTPEEYERMFTRYNANTRTVTPHGKETYRYFLKYNDRNNIT